MNARHFAPLLLCFLPATSTAQESTISVHADRPLHTLSRYLNGACIEDVNHEIYGGLYSQMIFGESFQEPPPPRTPRGFTAYGGRWDVREGDLYADAGEGPKLVDQRPAFADAEVGVDVLLPGNQKGNAGLLLRASQPGIGADRFTGYEVSLESEGRLILGRHRQNWELLCNVPCEVRADRWTDLRVSMKGRMIGVSVDGRLVLEYEDVQHPITEGHVGLRTWQRPARFRNLSVDVGGVTRNLAFEPSPSDRLGESVSGPWRPVRTGSARAEFAIETANPFLGTQSQRVTFQGGEGSVGVENQGLNRWGLNVVAGKPFEGHLWARAGTPTQVVVAMESRDGARSYAETRIDVRGDDWARYEFTLTPSAPDTAGRFSVSLRRPGSVAIGYAFLQPGDWGRYKGLPVRKDVVEALVAQGLTVLRYGGSMINHPAYRWKDMIGPRDRRPNVPGTWYPHSTNGWGIPDFLNVCEAAGFLAIPAFHMGETPQDMADFVEYANGAADSPWGRKRVADGHPEPYRLKHIELGNEEAVNDDYWRAFRPRAEAVWAKDPGIILVVGDFAYGKVIDDPFHFEGGAVVNTLAAHQKILELAKQRGKEVWFDIHISTNQPPEPRGLRPERSYIAQLERLAPGANFKVAIFEFNSGNHAMKRALSNACAINAVERIGDRIPVACSANCLQPDGQNDNGWDQGLLFLNPSRVWLQPPGYVTRMVARHDQPVLVSTEVQSPGDALDVTATRDREGKTLVLKVVNTSDRPIPARFHLSGFVPGKPEAAVETLSGPPDGVNTADHPDLFQPAPTHWRHGIEAGRTMYTFPAYSFTVVRLE